MKIKKRFFAVFGFIFLLSFGFLTCGDETPEKEIPPEEKPAGPKPEEKPIPEPTGFISRNDDSFYGIMEFYGGPVDDGMSEKIAPLVKAMGFKTFRISAHQDGLINRTAGNGVALNQSGVNSLKTQIKELKDAGVEHFVAVNHHYKYPQGFTDAWQMGVFPEPGTSHYENFMQMIEESYELMAKEFAEDIIYWECGNEINHDQYSHKIAGEWDAFTFLEKVQIATDLMYFASKGMKKGNPYALAVMPGLVYDAWNPNDEDIVHFVRQIYANIASGNYPSVGTEKSKNPDDYFDYLNWHPYNWSGNSGIGVNSDPVPFNFVENNKAIYDEAIAGGDDGKAVIFSEFGYTTTEDPFNLPRDQMETRQENFLVQDLKNIKEYLPFVEGVILFRLFDWEDAADELYPGSIEIGYGLFRSVKTSYQSFGPKKMTAKLFHHINGENADVNLLY